MFYLWNLAVILHIILGLVYLRKLGVDEKYKTFSTDFIFCDAR